MDYNLTYLAISNCSAMNGGGTDYFLQRCIIAARCVCYCFSSLMISDIDFCLFCSCYGIIELPYVRYDPATSSKRFISTSAELSTLRPLWDYLLSNNMVTRAHSYITIENACKFISKVKLQFQFVYLFILPENGIFMPGQYLYNSCNLKIFTFLVQS